MDVSPPPPREPPPPVPELSGGKCPACGAPYEPLQEYCLECGLRLPPTHGVIASLGRAWRRRLPWYPGDWIWPVLLGLVIAALGAVVAIVATREDGAGGETLVATHRIVTTISLTTASAPTVTFPTPTVPTATAPTAPNVTTINVSTRPAPTATAPSTTVPTATVPTTVAPATTAPATTPATTAPATTAPATTAPPPPAGGLAEWPAGRSGYTVVLASLPSSAGLAAARANARRAGAAGLPDVGVLDSSRYSSLHPGYYVIFSGIYHSLAAATSALAQAHASGFPAAYAREIAS